MSDEPARKQFTEFTECTTPILDVELDEFWATLPPATIEVMIGEWKGRAFDTGHPFINDSARWFGKTFFSAADVQPLICLDDAGNKFSNTDLGNGEATLWMEEFRGEVTATMVYDGQPLHDHFKKVDDNTVMGIMNGKHALKTGTYGYFYLERV